MERRAELAGRLAAVRERIAAACAAAGRDPDQVELMAVTKTVPAADVADGRLALSFDWSFLAGEADPVASHLNDYAAFTITDGTTVHVVKLDDALALKTGASQGGWHTSQLNLQALFPSSAGSKQVTIGFAVLNDGADYDPWATDAVDALDPRPAVVEAAEVAGVAEGGDLHVWYSPDAVQQTAAFSGLRPVAKAFGACVGEM